MGYYVEVKGMISYKPLVKTLKSKGIGIFELQTMIKNNKLRVMLNTGRYLDCKTLDKICSVLRCKVEEVCEYVEGPQIISEKPVSSMFVLNVDKVKLLCLEKNMPITKISKDMGFSSGYLNATFSACDISEYDFLMP